MAVSESFHCRSLGVQRSEGIWVTVWIAQKHRVLHKPNGEAYRRWGYICVPNLHLNPCLYARNPLWNLGGHWNHGQRQKWMELHDASVGRVEHSRHQHQSQRQHHANASSFIQNDGFSSRLLRSGAQDSYGVWNCSPKSVQHGQLCDTTGPWSEINWYLDHYEWME